MYQINVTIVESLLMLVCPVRLFLSYHPSSLHNDKLYFKFVKILGAACMVTCEK